MAPLHKAFFSIFKHDNYSNTKKSSLLLNICMIKGNMHEPHTALCSTKNTHGQDFDRFGTEWIRMEKAHYSLPRFTVCAK